MSNLSTPLEPAASIIAKFGGPDAVEEITGASRTRVYRWTQPIDRHGTGGEIPLKPMKKLLAHGRANGIDVSLDDFMPAPKRAKRRASIRKSDRGTGAAA